jgi:ankyrin repeat protein
MMAKLLRTAVVFGLLLTICSCKSNHDKLLAGIRQKDIEAVRRIVADGIDLNPISGLHDVNKPLAYAAAYGNLEIVKLLIKAGADLNGQVAYGDVALIKADEHGNVEILEYLIEQGADVNLPNLYGMTPFIGLCGSGRLNLVQFAATHGADVNSSYRAKVGEGAGMKNFSPLETAAFRGRLDVVKLLLSLGADPRTKDYKGRSPIELAKSKGHEDVAKLLQKQLDSVKKD